MDKKSNMKKAMYEMFGVGGDGSEAASTAPAQVKSASVEVKSAPGAEKKSMDHAPAKTPEARPAASFLAPGTVFEGSFRAKGDIEIAGELKGDVTSEGSVLLRSNLQSNITAGSVKLTGCTLIGDITANGPVTVSEDSKVTGNITAQSLLCAGEINGDIRISGNTQMDANARVSGSVVTGTISVAAGKELPVSYDLSKPQEDREPYVGSVLFFKHVIFTVTLLLILIPTTLSIYLFAQVRSLSRQLDAAGSQLAAMQEQLPSTTPEGGEPTPAEPDPPAAEVPAYTELYPELYADDSLRGTVDVDNAVYLTFDDGPSARTDEILEILDKYGVKATFFVVGANEEGDLERMQKIVAAGHTLAIHSYSHDYKKIYASVEAYLEDFNQMFCQIYEATGVKPQIFRFPGGSVNSYNVGIHQQLIAEMTRRGFVYFDWNVANGDAVFSKIQPSSTLTANALKGVGTARRAIILMHDSSAKTTTVEALPAIIEGYLEAGYSFAALTPSTRSVTFSYLD